MFIRHALKRGSPDCCAMAVMAKASSPGRTKTRLSPPLSLEQAADLNSVFLADIADNVALASREADIAGYMAFGPPGGAAFFETRMPMPIGLFEAWLPNFGDCLLHALRTLLDCGYGAACVLNSDSPTLSTALLVEAARALNRPGRRIVVGPSADGGYYLLGMKQLEPRLFEQIAWSTPTVLAQTLERAAELGLEAIVLAPWYDVDDGPSLRSLAAELLDAEPWSAAHRGYKAPHTAAWLRRHWPEATVSSMATAPTARSVSRAP